MSIRHVVEVENGETGEAGAATVVGMFDRFSNKTNDPTKAWSGVVELPNGFHVTFDPDELPIFTVH